MASTGYSGDEIRSLWAWQFSRRSYTADLHSWTRFMSMQNQYSLVQCEKEREGLGLLAGQADSIPRSRF